MGCTSGDKEKIEDQMMLMKLERMEIQMEKEKHAKKLSEMEGKDIKPGNIPDYIDPEFAKEKNIYDDDDGNENLKTDAGNKKDKKDKKDKEKSKKEKSKKEKVKEKKPKEKEKKEKKEKKDKKDDKKDKKKDKKKKK